MAETRLILASQSAARRQMLTAAGVTFSAVTADVDEAAIKSEILKANDKPMPRAVAERLASAKAEAVSRAEPEALVIGADQVLAFDGGLISKAKNIDDARAVLRRLAGNTHHLFSAVALAEAGRTVWSFTDSAELAMRPLSDAFLSSYLEAMGDRVLKTVGCYELEGFGAQLFDRVSGDYFTVLGIPLLPLLSELRRKGVVMT